jgi:flagellar assembly protein FliH
LQQTASTIGSSAPGRIELFEYPASPDAPEFPSWNGWAEEEPAEASGPAEPRHNAAEGGLCADFDRRLAEETRRSFEAGRERGKLEGHQAEREARAAAQSSGDEMRVRQVADLIESFAEERDRFLRTVEHEVVELALAVAARILRREAQMDPLLLTGAVRVALGQLSRSTQVRLRVPTAGLMDRGYCSVAESGGEARRDCRGRNAAGRLRDRDRVGLGGPGDSRPVGRD